MATDYNYVSTEITIKDNAIVRPEIPFRLVQPKNTIRFGSGLQIGRHSTRAEKQISSVLLHQYLLGRGSPLAEYAEQIGQSPYYSTIIGICTIEEYGCTHNPGNNMWGLMSGGHLIVYPTLQAGITAVSNFLDRAYNNGHTTVESLNCWYVQPCSDTWLNVVLKIKAEVEALQ